MYYVQDREELNTTLDTLVEQLDELESEFDFRAGFTDLEQTLDLDELINSYRRVIAYNSIPGKFRGGIYDLQF
jgi:hypothetical protein